MTSQLEEEAFNPDYVEIDRVLDVSETTDAESNEQTKHYLVKWRGLPYDDSTWELEEDIEKEKIEQFFRFKEPPSKDQIKVVLNTFDHYTAGMRDVTL